MKNFLLIFCLTMLCYAVKAQNENKKWPDSLNITLPSKDGYIFYEQVVAVDSASKDQLYNAARTWFSNMFKSAKSVLDMDDRNSGKLIGKGNLTYSSVQKNFGERRAGFTIDITVKDGKYRVQLTDVKDLSDGDKITGETFGDLNAYNNENYHPEIKQRYKAKFKYAALSSFDISVKSILASLKNAMVGYIKDDF